MTATSATVRQDAHLTLGRVVRSEWIKFTSLRSTYWTTGIILVLWLGIALLFALTANFTAVGPDGQPIEPNDEMRQSVTMTAVTTGAFFGMLVAAIQGVLTISGEYSTGMIRSSLAAVPGRLAVLLGKAVVVFVWMFLLGAVSSLGAYLVALPFLGSYDLAVPLGSEELLAMLGAAAYLGIVGLFGLGIGTLVRSAAGGIAITVAVLMVIPMALGVLSIWIDGIEDIVPYMLDSAGNAMMTIPSDTEAALPPGMEAPTVLAPPVAALVASAWAAVALVLGALALKGRDA
ncbi:ABC transporter permease [Salinibacterium sp. SYSU T00001]|uniref:ABC transporter permease n=1 Tax=Homoserinimonas sedimenticola TaxID=2986805 RepID=UPI002236793E|nr:ABC transporter permease [Salinibacterium sedimenticola]MCW4386775.1 ABC transporter permease [Salinibacterium sedimenticola]